VGPSSWIAAGTHLAGRLTAGADLHFAGRLSGEIAVEGELVLAAGAEVEGPLTARAVFVAGGVRGPILGVERVEIQRGGSVTGDITSACVVLGEGAELDGRIDITA
jgi:cytoskeletal protein CcmA (bactofilin family)